MKLLKTIAGGIALALFTTTAQAATVATGVTKVGDTGGINLQGAATAVAGNNTGIATAAGSDIVWGTGGEFSTEIFEFAFDLTGFDTATAQIMGGVSVDNEAVVKLNGTTLLSLTGAVFSHFTQINTYSHSTAATFNAGANLLTIEATDLGGIWGLSADVIVTADELAPVPLPAGLPLLLAGLGGLALMRGRRG